MADLISQLKDELAQAKLKMVDLNTKQDNLQVTLDAKQDALAKSFERLEKAIKDGADQPVLQGLLDDAKSINAGLDVATGKVDTETADITSTPEDAPPETPVVTDPPVVDPPAENTGA